MKLRRYLALGTLLLTVGFAASAHAATVEGTNSYNLASGQTTQGNLYIGSGDATIAGHVTGELVVAGGTVDLTGRVDQSVSVLGGTVTIDGPVGGNLHVLGGHVTVNSTVNGDLLVGTGNLEIPASGSVGGDLIGAAGSFSLSGKVGGDVRLYAGNVDINGAIGGSLLTQVGNLTIGESAQIAHDVRYKSRSSAQISPAAKIGGSTVYTHANGSNYGAFSALGLLFRLILLYVAALVLIALFRRHSGTIAQTFDSRFLPSLLVGFGFIILAPIVGILLFISIVGVYLSIMLLLAYILIILLAFAYSAISLGYVVVHRFGDGPMHPFLSALIGVALVVLVTTIPVIGGIVGFILIMAASGAILLTLFDRGRATLIATPEVAPAAETGSPKPRRRRSTKTER